MRGSAREIFVRSMKAIVYITNATGMIRSQRWVDTWKGFLQIVHVWTKIRTGDCLELNLGSHFLNRGPIIKPDVCIANICSSLIGVTQRLRAADCGGVTGVEVGSLCGARTE